MISQGYRTVALLVEMMADDHALRVRGLLARELAMALLRFGTAGADCAPAGALAAAEGELTARVNRILAPQPPLPRVTQAAVVLSAAALVAIPVLLMVVPSLLPGDPAVRDYQGPYGPEYEPLPFLLYSRTLGRMPAR
jgi:hypothetical protein